MKGNAEAITEGLEVGGVRLVLDIGHADMESLDGEVGDVNLGTTGEELQQTQRVLATRQAHEDFVVLVDELVLAQRFVESLPEFFFERHNGLLR